MHMPYLWTRHLHGMRLACAAWATQVWVWVWVWVLHALCGFAQLAQGLYCFEDCATLCTNN